jgi:YD repeat-containing protein
MRRTALLLLACGQLMAETSPQVSVAFEGAPSSRINHSVSTISGEHYDDVVDCVVAGVDPIVVRRSYCSADRKQYTNLGQWRLMGGVSLVTGDTRRETHGKVEPMTIAFGESGSRRPLTRRSDGAYRVADDCHEHGMTNFGAGILSARTNPRRLRFNATDGELKCGNGCHKYYVRSRRGFDGDLAAESIWALTREELPSGKWRRYDWSESGRLTAITTLTQDNQPINAKTPTPISSTSPAATMTPPPASGSLPTPANPWTPPFPISTPTATPSAKSISMASTPSAPSATPPPTSLISHLPFQLPALCWDFPTVIPLTMSGHPRHRLVSASHSPSGPFSPQPSHSIAPSEATDALSSRMASTPPSNTSRKRQIFSPAKLETATSRGSTSQLEENLPTWSTAG